jgi:hypothetical protein
VFADILIFRLHFNHFNNMWLCAEMSISQLFTAIARYGDCGEICNGDKPQNKGPKGFFAKKAGNIKEAGCGTGIFSPQSCI